MGARGREYAPAVDVTTAWLSNHPATIVDHAVVYNRSTEKKTSEGLE